MKTQSAALVRDHLRQFFFQNEHIQHWYVGFSGGLDSSLLLALAAELLPKEQLTAVHINHQLQSAAFDWQESCQRVADSLGVSYKSIQVDCLSSSESAARKARMDAFLTLLPKGCGLLLAHHATDQAETVLMRLIRGTGVSGAAGMQARRCFGQGDIFRPLLNLTRKQIELAAQELKLSWLEDPSNQNVDYTRNYIRQQVAPLIESRWAGWDLNVAKGALRFAEADELLNELAEADLSSLVASQKLDLAAFAQLSLARRKNIIYRWLGRYLAMVPSSDQVEHIAKLAVDAKGEWRISSITLHAYQGSLYLEQEMPCATDALEWYPASTVGQFTCGQLRLTQGKCDEVLFARTRIDGEKVLIPKRGGQVSIKKLMNERQIPPWHRGLWPVVELNGKVISIPGVWEDDSIPFSIEFKVNSAP